MNRYEIALFDLDGTLSESGEGILDCVRRIFIEMDRPMPDEKSLAAFIGPPMHDSLVRCGFNEEDSAVGVEIYKRNFLEHGIYKNKLYDGIQDVLEELRNSGVRLGVASTKYQKFTDRIIRMLGIDGYFDIIAGSDTLSTEVTQKSGHRHNKVDVMNYAIESLRRSENDRVVMIGDTKYDADGAARTGCDFIGCLFGYGSREEMISFYTSGKPYFVSVPSEITPIII